MKDLFAGIGMFVTVIFVLWGLMWVGCDMGRMDARSDFKQQAVDEGHAEWYLPEGKTIRKFRWLTLEDMVRAKEHELIREHYDGRMEFNIEIPEEDTH